MSEVVEVSLAPVETIPRGEGRCFVVGEHRIAVFRQRDGALYASQDSCPHRDAPLSDGLIGGGHVICPYHGYKFNLTTGECLTDPECRLRTYPVRDDAGQIRIRIDGQTEGSQR